MSIKAKYPGKCPLCFVRFVVGQDDIENKQGKWVHVDCNLAKASQEQPGRVSSASVRSAVDYSRKATRNVPVAVSDNNSDELSNFLASAIESVPVEVHHEEKVFTPSVYQKAIFEAIEKMVKNISVSKHLVIEAVAGSGKTTTIVQALKIIPDTFETAFIAFNKHIVNELKKRTPAYIHVSTLHSLGLEVIRNNIKNVKVDEKGDKLNDVLNSLYPVQKILVEQGKITKEERQKNYVKRSGMRNLVSITMATLTNPENKEEVYKVIEHYGVEIDFDHMEEIIEALPSVLENCKKNQQLVSFDEMIWLPIVCNMSFPKFDFLMVDEFQDMNKSQIEFILNSVSESGHIIAVGDRNQSLYGFRGADTEAIPNAIERLKAEVLPLSVTYRCPALHVQLAKRIVPQLEAKEGAIDGEVIDLPYFKLLDYVQPGDMVICRTNAPLIKPAFACIRKGMKAIIRGREIGNSLIALVKRFETNDLNTFEINLHEYYEKELEKLLDHGKEMQALLLTDKVQTLRFVLAECDNVAELISKIQMLFDDNNIGVIFSSVHRAKGLEAENVFILKPDLMPHPKAEKDWEIQQEMNALYVAQTRSKNKMYIVKGGEDV